jgi:hypothetical protein
MNIGQWLWRAQGWALRKMRWCKEQIKRMDMEDDVDWPNMS